MTSPLTINSNQLIIIDSQVTDWQSLVGNISPDATVLILNSTRDGVSQIVELVANYSNLAAIHIISHGSAGNLLLGSSSLNNSNIADYTNQLANIGTALNANGDILLYACNVAQGDSGTAFINKLAFFTGANIAASANLIGNDPQGSNWILEQQIGNINSFLPIPKAVLANYAHTLVNRTPIALADTLAATEDTAITYTAAQLLGNDSDADNNPLTIVNVTSVANGTAVLNADGTVTFTPNPNFNGVAYFTYQANDGTVNSSPALVTVNVAPVNDAPVANPDIVFAIEDTSIIYTAGQLLGNDTDIDGNPLTIASVTSGSNGTAVLNSDGTVTFTPNANFNGVATFSYKASDGTINSNPATVSVTVLPVNDAPVANADALNAIEDTPITYTAAQLLGNDTDVDGDFLTIASVTSGSNGTAVLNGDGTVTFTPNANFNGVADFSYQATDGSLLSNAATVTVHVAAVNDAPIANPDTLTATEDTAITYTAAQLLGNDTDAENDAFSIIMVTSGTNGIASLNADGTVTFTPTANFNGVATFSYQLTDGSLISAPALVTVNVAPVNDAPVAVADTLAATEDTPITYTAAQLLGNDTDIDGNPLTIGSVTSGANGTVVLNADGTVTFTPNANFNGVADFTYQATDGIANSNSATVTVNVAPVNDAPVAVADTLAATEDTAVIYTAAQLLGNDTDVDSPVLSIISVTSGANGTAVLNGDGTVTFTPNANFNGVADFTYQATDGLLLSNTATVTVNVAPVNDAPVANPETLIALEDTATTYTAAQLLGNDTDIDGNPLTIASVTNGTGGTVVLNANGTVTFTSAPNFNGVATFSYQASDGTANSNSATVTVNVFAVNDAPVAVADTLSANEDTAIIYTAAQLLGNDTDAENNPLIIASVTSGSNGTAVLNADGTVTFTPNANFNGVADFSYKTSDGLLLSNAAIVTVNVAAVNDAPVAVADTLAATEDTAITYTAAQLLGNDTDVDSPVLTIASVTSGANGTAVLNADGTVTFTPNANFSGAANFTYQATDGALLSNTVTVTVNVAAVNDAPVAVADTLAATEDTVIIYTAAQLLGNDTDVDSPVLTIASVTSGSNGTAVLNSDGTVSFTPNANFNGVATFSYKATDGLLLSNSATVTVNVAPVNDAPVANADALNAIEDTPITYTAAQLLGNDTDVDGPALSIGSVTSGTNGTVVLNGDGTVTFTPNANFNGVADFSYQATDGSLLSNAATVTVHVAAVNDAPIANPDTLTATEDTAITYTAAQLLGNDTDAENDAFSIIMVTSGTNGIASLNADGTVTFTPTANFNGVATFSYQLTDGSLISAPALVTVNVAPVNDAPVAVADTLAATEDTPITYTAAQLLGNDTDIDGNPLTIGSVTSGANGTVVLNADGTVTFTPNANFNGVADFTYQATDGIANSNSATVTVNVAPVNDAPVAVADTLAATEDTAVIYTAAQLLGNDTDVDSPVLSIISVTSGANGTAVLNADGTVTFTPNANFSGAANFTYQATDGLLLSNTATVTVNVAPVNDAPVANPDSLVAPEDFVITYLASDLLGNDTDAEGSPLTIASVTSGNNGTAVLNANGSVTFTSALNFNGIATFTYKASDGLLNSNSATVSVNVVGTNDAPVLTTPATVTYIDTPFVDTFTTATGFLVGIDVDTGTTLTYGITGGTDNGDGTVSMSGTYGVLTVTKLTGEYKFVPNVAAIEPLGENVSSTFTVVVSDGALSTSKPFTVAITQSGSTETNGSDVLVNGVGITHWAGLQGDDTYYVDVAGDVITENVGQGTDTVFSLATSYTLSDNVENLVIWGAGVNGTGNALNNYIFGSTGNNTIDGGLGADIMYGDLGSDAYYVDNIGDVTSEIGTDWDVVYSTAASYTLNANIEALFLVDGANRNGNGNSQDNYLLGNTGNNILDGKGGADVMVGYAGDDTYYVDNIGDSVIENASEGFDTVNSSINYTLTGNVEALTLTGAATQGFGNNLNNTLTGNSANNVLGGGSGADTMIGGAGNDAYYVDNVLDTVIENVGEGTDTVYSTAASYTLADNVENLVIWGTNGTGNAQNNYIFGNTGSNIMDGGAGNDVLYGDEGADTYIGGLGADVLSLTEVTPMTDIVRVATGDSLATIGGYDTVSGFKLGTGVFNTIGVDQLDLDNTAIAINAASVDGADVANIRSHSLSNGIISFDDINSYTAPLTITTADLSNVFSYLQTEITGGLTVAFISEGNTYVFQDGGAVDTVVELVGVTASSVNTLGQGTNALWLV